MATSISLPAAGLKGDRFCSSLHGNWASSIPGEHYGALVRSSRVKVVRTRPVRTQPVMKNVNEGKGLFAPVMVIVRSLIGKKRFNQIRGKAIALHSQVINEFCKTIGADGKRRQGLIRLVKKSGGVLDFLA